MTDLPRPLLLSSTALILANAIPLALAAAGIWDLGELVGLYWAETLIIGFFTVVTILIQAATGRSPGGYQFALFFVLIFGAFCSLHGLFLADVLIGLPSDQTLLGFVFSMDGLLLPFLALLASHGISFATHVVKGGELDFVGLENLSYRPFSRLFVLHLTIVASAFVLVFIGTPVIALIIFVLIKIWVDLNAHITEHRSDPATGAGADT